MLTIAVLNQKGGAGKTTCATNLAAAAHLSGKRTLLIDMDAQSSAFDWGNTRPEGSRLEGLTVTKNDCAIRLPHFRELARGYDVIILDGPPRLGDVTRSAAIAADVVLIPMRASAFDMWACAETLKLLDSADGTREEIHKRPVRRVFALNSAVRRTGVLRAGERALADHHVAGSLGHRVAFSEAVAAGESVLTLEEKGEAAREVRRLWRAIASKGRS